MNGPLHIEQNYTNCRSFDFPLLLDGTQFFLDETKLHHFTSGVLLLLYFAVMILQRNRAPNLQFEIHRC